MNRRTPFQRPAPDPSPERIPVHTLSGVPDADVSTHWLTTDDGLSLSAFRFTRPGNRRVKDTGAGDTVLLIPGHTLSSDMYIMPEHHNLVTYLLDNGYHDVWVMDGRNSSRFTYNLTGVGYTVDDLALRDLPPVFARIREISGHAPLHVIAHCLGSVSLLMGVTAGVITGVRSAVINSVGLIPRLPTWSLAKIAVAPDVLDLLGVARLNPGWSRAPLYTPAGALGRLVSLFHQECDDEYCHMLSFMWGAGRPALFRHENLLDETHSRLADLCGPAPTSYDKHIRRMALVGRAVSWHAGGDGAGQVDYTRRLDRLDFPMLLLSGEHNQVFADSNRIFHNRLIKDGPGSYEYRELPGYGHVDPFIGAHSDLDVFPHIVEFLRRHGGPG